MKKPDDPLCHIWDCVVNPDEGEPGISISTEARATAQARYAAERGIAFQEVQCLRVYVHIYTRQEAWLAYGRRAAALALANWCPVFGEAVGWYFAGGLRLAAAPGVTADGYYYDDLDENGLHQPVSPEDAAWIENPPAIVPDDWEPDDGDPAWERSTRDDPRAIPAWECSEF